MSLNMILSRNFYFKKESDQKDIENIGVKNVCIPFLILH